MQATNTSLASVFRNGLTFGRLIFAGVFIFAAIGSVWGQTPTPKPVPGAKQSNWHKYVNQEYGFSFWYPDTYRPTNTDEGCKDNDYRRYLLCVEQLDNSDESIGVTTIIAGPFRLYPDRSDEMPRPKLIGHHVFYSKIVGSPAVGFGDHYDLNLRGKTLEIEFTPARWPPTTATPPFELKVLKTFRTFLPSKSMRVPEKSCRLNRSMQHHLV